MLPHCSAGTAETAVQNENIPKETTGQKIAPSFVKKSAPAGEEITLRCAVCG